MEGSTALPDASSATDYIQVSVKTVQEHFSGELIYNLPWFQRSYAWQEENAARLLHDIVEASSAERGRYFLGHVMLALPEGTTNAAIIDGQQRMLTLTILFALLRDRAPSEKDAQEIDRLISLEGSDTYRVTPQPAYAKSFATYVQEPQGTSQELQDDVLEYLECERNFLNNRDQLKHALDELVPDSDAWFKLKDFLLERCTLVIEIVGNEDEAWEMLSIEETTGLGFNSSERSKIAIVSAMPREVHEKAGENWDIWQARLGADGMSKLLGHIRLLRHGKRSSKPVEQGLIELYKLNKQGLSFVDTVLIPQSERYYTLCIEPMETAKSKLSEAITEPLQYLRWLEREPWVPPALNWLEHRSNSGPETEFFFKQLDGLAWVMRIATRDPIEQERRFLRIANAISAGKSIQEIDDLKIDSRILKAASDNLLSKTFFDKSCSRLVLRRLSDMLGKDPGPINGDGATVEHVLPRRPAKGTGWFNDFKNKAVIDDHVHRLGNLAVLSFTSNQKAGSMSFEDKQPVLAESGLSLAEQIAAIDSWQPQTIIQRSIALASELLAQWDQELVQS
ncbi:MAG: DUF262 domain-containing HNH endonuclease family protein [Pseudomonadota bacterium]